MAFGEGGEAPSALDVVLKPSPSVTRTDAFIVPEVVRGVAEGVVMEEIITEFVVADVEELIVVGGMVVECEVVVELMAAEDVGVESIVTEVIVEPMVVE